MSGVDECHFQFKCCGINDVTDFDTTPKWDKTEGYKVDGNTVTVTVSLPTTCCKMTGSFPGSSLALVDNNCPVTPTDVNSYQNTVSYTLLYL